MDKLRRGAAAVLASLCLAGAVPVGAADTAVADKWLRLSENTAGPRYIVDAAGKPFKLFGMARCQSCAPLDEDPIYLMVDGVASHFKEIGCNSMRLAIDVVNQSFPHGDFIEDCGGYNEEGIQKFITQYVDPDVQAIIGQGMYVILDLHLYPKGEPEDPDPANLVKQAREKYIPIWRELAKRYKDEPMVAMYELWNEPYAADQGTLKLTDSGRIREGKYRGYDWKSDVRQFFIDCAAAIREIDQRHMLLVSDWNAGWGCAWQSMWGEDAYAADPTYRNLLFSVHAGHQQLSDEALFGSGFNMDGYWAELAERNNIALHFGEVEAEEKADSDCLGSFAEMLGRRADTHRYSAMLWRPRGDERNRVDLWGDFAAAYASKPVEQFRMVIEAETTRDPNFTRKADAGGFGSPFGDTIAVMKQGMKKGEFAAVRVGRLFPAGTYELRVRTLGDEDNSAAQTVGILTESGKNVEIGTLLARQDSEYGVEVLTFTAGESFSGFSFNKQSEEEMGCNPVDRLVLTADGALEPPLIEVKYDTPVKEPSSADGEKSGGLSPVIVVLFSVGGMVIAAGVVLAALLIRNKKRV